MSKIICDICGTSYPETTKQCPICGCVRPGDARRVTNDDKNTSAGYTQVKGGHFSKGSVKKRSKDTKPKPAVKKNDPAPSYAADRESRGLVIVAIILLLAVIGVVIYIAVRFIGPISNPNDGTISTGNVQEIACTDIILDSDTLTFDEAGEVLLLNVTVQPKNTSDLLSYRSEDTNVVTVNSVGKVTVVGEGTTEIVITCGNITKKCTVTVQYPESSDGNGGTEGASDPTGETGNAEGQLRLNRMDITFSSKGSTWNLYDGSIPRNQITWTSDDVSVASFTDGVVMAVGNGTTTVHAELGDQKVSCTIRCTFTDNSGVTGNGGVSEDGGNTGNTVSGTVTTTINIRLNPGTNNETCPVINGLIAGDRVTILEQKTVDGMTWGRISQGWICMDYVKLD